MSQEYRFKETCRLCGGTQLLEVLSLPNTPLANEFVTPSSSTHVDDLFPLSLVQCHDCWHVQLSVVVSPDRLFRNYLYVSGTSLSFVLHFEEYAKCVHRIKNLTPSSRVLDIGSNDGTLLKEFKKLVPEMESIGIDPAIGIAKEANSHGVKTIPEFFNSKVASRLKGVGFDVITANNVFAHVDDLIGMASNIHSLLKDDGIFVFEVSYLLDVVQNCLFDTIYHEHLSYHSIGPLVEFFHRVGLELFDISRVNTHGGSIRCFVAKKDKREVRPIVEDMILSEESIGISGKTSRKLPRLIFKRFESEIESKSRILKRMLNRMKTSSLAGFGAPAKLTTMMYTMNLCDRGIKFIVDESSMKQGHLTPGTRIPIVPPSVLLEDNPKHCIIFAWNFSESVCSRYKGYTDAGGSFIIPLPHLSVRTKYHGKVDKF